MSGQFEAGDGSRYIWPAEQEVKRRQVQHEHYYQEPENNLEGTNPKTEFGSPITSTTSSACPGTLASAPNNSVLPNVLAEALLITSRRVNALSNSQNNNSFAPIQAVQSHSCLLDASAICPLSEP